MSQENLYQMVEKEKRRRPGRPRSFDPDEVLDKAIDVFWELGYDSSDTETLAKRTGLTKPSLYNAFGSKEDLFVAALDRYRKTRSKAAFDAMMEAKTPEEGIRDYFLCKAESVAGQNHPPGCLIMSIAMPLCDRLPKVAGVLHTAVKESNARMQDYFNEQIERGNLPPDFNNASAIALIQDLSAAMIMQARPGASIEALKDRAIRNSRLVLLEGKTPH